MKNKVFLGYFSLIAMLLLIMDPQTALNGASQGIYQCITVIIPSLFPFFFLSSLLCSVLIGSHISFFQPVRKLLRLPAGSESLFLLGLLGGYPVGAQAISTAWSGGKLSTNDAKRMLGFCSNAGPSFIFGMAASLFESAVIPWLLWVIHILSAIAVGLSIPGKSGSNISTKMHTTITLPAALKKSITITATVCGWVIIFRVLIAYFDKIFLTILPPTAKAAIIGILELANGCIGLQQVPSSAVRFILCSIFLAFGGICVSLQTCSVVGNLGSGLYFPGKCLQTLVSFILSWIVSFFLFPQQLNIPWCIPALLLLIITTMLLIFRHKMRKRYGNYAGCDI